MKILPILLLSRTYDSLMSHLRPIRALVIVLSVLFAVGCSSNDDDGANAGDPADPGNGDETAMVLLPDGVSVFISARTPSFDAGQIEQISLEGSAVFPATSSDIRVATDGSDVYQIGRFGLESITRFSQTDLNTPIYQYSVAQGGSPNPQAMVFVDESKAYVVQLGTPFVLIVNPSAMTEEEFITGQIDISGYDPDGIPQASGAVIANGQLFVLMQRLTGPLFQPEMSGAVAVFDIATDTEIDTGSGVDGLNGIILNSLNPEGIQYVPEFNEVVITGRGNTGVGFNELPGDPYQGALETIDVDTYALDVLVDDDELVDDINVENRPFIVGSVVASAERGYIISSESFANNTLRSFNPTTGVIEEGVVAGLEGLDLTLLALGPAGRVWVGVGGEDNPGLVVLDPATNEVIFERVATEFVPSSIVFTQ